MTPADFAPYLFGSAEIRAPRFDQMSVGAAVALTLGGVVLRVILPWVQMNAEEQAKDRILTELEARHRIRFYRWGATIMTLAGVAVLGFVMVDLAQ